MVVRKILEATLVAGSTSVTFTDTDIPNSLLRVYCSRSALFPISQTLSGNSVTVNYKPQDSNIGVALEIVKSGLDIVDDLTTEDNTKALSANQGYVLKGLIDGIVIPTVPENITDLDDVDVTDIANGQVLAWNSTTEKFENVNQSGGGGNNYNLDETVIGSYLGETLYRKVIPIGVLTYGTSTWVSVAHNISNLKRFTNISGAFKGTSDNRMYNIPTYRVTTNTGISLGADATNVYYINNWLNGAADCYVVLEYTKTS